ncbi:MAG: TetR/AcrR family transcriptional regulator [bacterium]
MKARARQDTLMQAATRCFAKNGYHSTGVSDIIETAGVARGTFYLYFKSKLDVFSRILDDFIAHLGDQIKTIELGSGMPPAQQMRANVERLVDAITKKPGPAKIIFNEAVGLNPEIDGKLRAFYGRLISIIEASLNKGISLGLVRKVDPSAAACIITGGFRELMVQKIVFRNARLEKGAIVDGLIDVILGGLGGRPVVN